VLKPKFGKGKVRISQIIGLELVADTG
jgi:hypothetical protein